MSRTNETFSTHQLLQRSRQTRDFIVLSGDFAWGESLASGFVGEDAVWLCGQKSNHQPDAPWLPAPKGRRLLGASVNAVVFDACSEFDPDLFALVAGSINGGGVLVLLVPALEEWPQQYFSPATRFLTRLVTQLRSYPGVRLLEQHSCQSVPQATPVQESNVRPSEPERADCATLDQQRAVEQIVHVVTGHRRRPLVLISDRGRGKSAALGIGAADLLRRGLRRIVVTAPRLSATDSLFEILAGQFPGGKHSRGLCQLDEAEVIYLPPDHLSLQQEQADLLMVDEAAAIPASLLNKLLQRYSRIVFATTVHGYEGNGRGFAVRFFKILDQETPGWKQLLMQAPIRWADNDLLEQFVFDALLLKAEPVDGQLLAGLTPGKCEIVCLDRNLLQAKEEQLEELFGLLIIAHYQTSASDLRQLLDDPDVSVYAAIFGGKHIAAAALVVEEGGLDVAVGEQVRQGRRRLKGHLAAQSLGAYLGLADASSLSCRRIMRIAVHPDFQSRGLGSAMLETVAADAGEAGIDYLATSFGANPQLLSFWKQAGFSSVKMGTRRNAASACYSSLLLSPVSSDGNALFMQASDRFAEIYPQLLQEELAGLEPETAIALNSANSSLAANSAETPALLEFANSARTYVSVLPELTRFAETLLLCGEEGNEDHQLVIMKVMQKRSWSDCARWLDLSGKAQTVERLRVALKNILTTPDA